MSQPTYLSGYRSRSSWQSFAFSTAERSALDVLDQVDLHHLVVAVVADDDRDLVQAGLLRRAIPALADDDLVVGVDGSNDDRLEDAVLLDTRGQVVKTALREAKAGVELVWLNALQLEVRHVSRSSCLWSRLGLAESTSRHLASVSLGRIGPTQRGHGCRWPVTAPRRGRRPVPVRQRPAQKCLGLRRYSVTLCEELCIFDAIPRCDWLPARSESNLRHTAP